MANEPRTMIYTKHNNTAQTYSGRFGNSLIKNIIHLRPVEPANQSYRERKLYI